jgi:hypothetical protein
VSRVQPSLTRRYDDGLRSVPRTDIRELINFASYRWRPKNGSVQSFGSNLYTEVNWDRRGRVQDWRINLPFEIEWRGQTSLFVRRSDFFTHFEGKEFRQHSHTVEFSTAWLKWLEIDALINQGTGVNFFPAEGIEPFLASSFDGEVEIVLRPNSQLRFEETYIYSRLGVREDTAPPGVAPTGSIFTNHIFRSKLNYQFNRELSMRAIIDYESVLPNTALIPLERSKRLGLDFLATYLVNPGTALYVAYTDGYENLAFDSGLPPSLRRTRAPTTSVGRQFFVKMSYLFRF